jgi:L-threonylcarbamoyladenylate synthase
MSEDEEARGPVRQAGGAAGENGQVDRPEAGPAGRQDGESGLQDEPRVIPVTADEAAWDGLLEVGTEVVARGGLIVLPTDTVYGIGCDPFSSSAVEALFAAKRRGRDLPLPVLVHGWRQAIGLVEEFTEQAKTLAAAWWPGPLTIVLREASGIGWDLGYSRGTVAVRMPKQNFALALIRRTGPLAVTSANRSGEATPATVAGILEQLGEDVDVLFDAGPAGDSPSSTIVDLTGQRPRLLREGAVPAGEIERTLGERLADGA